MLTASDLEDLARLVLETRGGNVGRIVLGDGVQKAYADNCVMLWHIVRTTHNLVIDEIQVDQTLGAGMPKYGRQSRVLIVRGGRVTFFRPNQKVEEHLIKLALLDVLARQAE